MCVGTTHAMSAPDQQWLVAGHAHLCKSKGEPPKVVHSTYCPRSGIYRITHWSFLQQPFGCVSATLTMPRAYRGACHCLYTCIEATLPRGTTRRQKEIFASSFRVGRCQKERAVCTYRASTLPRRSRPPSCPAPPFSIELFPYSLRPHCQRTGGRGIWDKTNQRRQLFRSQLLSCYSSCSLFRRLLGSSD